MTFDDSMHDEEHSVTCRAPDNDEAVVVVEVWCI